MSFVCGAEVGFQRLSMDDETTARGMACDVCFCSKKFPATFLLSGIDNLIAQNGKRSEYICLVCVECVRPLGTNNGCVGPVCAAASAPNDMTSTIQLG